MMKQHVCPIDRRRFATKAALDQHRLAKHGGVGSKPALTPRQRHGASGNGAPLSVPVSVRGRASDTAVLSGVDRLAELLLDVNIRPQSKMVDILITPGVFKRLTLVGRAFQKVKYRSLTFRIAPQVSSLVSGGYVAAFVRDPADKVDSIQALTSQRGSVTTKWWQNETVTYFGDRTFYTSESAEIREYSPGRFVLMCDGAPLGMSTNKVGNVTVFVEWSVELSGPSLESERQLTTNSTVLVDLYTRHNQTGFWKWTGVGPPDQDKDTWTQDPRQLISYPGGELFTGMYFKFQNPHPMVSSNKGMRLANWLYVSDRQVLPVYSAKGDIDTGGFPQIDLVVTQGSVVDYDRRVAEAGECQASSSHSEETTRLSEPCDQLKGLQDRLETLVKEVSILSSKLSEGSREHCLSSPEVLDYTES